MPSISVVIPSLNDAAMLRHCLAALAVQTRPADEIIVVDNASVDDTADVARSAGARVVTEPVRGVLSATTAGFDAATGDIIGRLDADCRPAPDWLEKVEAQLTDAAPLTALTGPGRFYDAHPIVCWLGETIYIGGYFWFVGLLLGRPPLFASNLALRAELWQRLRERIEPTLQRTHDDMHVSFLMTPDMTVIYDRSLEVGISPRPFSSLKGLARRIGWAWITLKQTPRWRRGQSPRRHTR